jgi:hypothetical protein
MTISRVDLEIPNAIGIKCDDEALMVELNDGRMISVPLAWYPRLLQATQQERQNWRLIGQGQGIHWEDLDEDISVENLLTGHHSGESQASLEKWLESRQKQQK